jgi:hypothetical protein
LEGRDDYGIEQRSSGIGKRRHLVSPLASIALLVNRDIAAPMVMLIGTTMLCDLVGVKACFGDFRSWCWCSDDKAGQPRKVCDAD